MTAAELGPYRNISWDPSRAGSLSAMHPAVLEAKVIAIVESVLDGGRAEDDLVELKSTWPDARNWARQLAALANRAAGPEIVVIVGVKEGTHELVPPGDMDLEEWWPTLRARFDEDTAPELARHLSVHLPSGGVVYALAFETDRAPYVIKSLDGRAPHLEVPMRSGTATRWAKRSELLRLLAPHVTTPTVVPLSATANIDWHAKNERRGEMLSTFVTARFFVEHIDPSFAMIPYHTISATLQAGGINLGLQPDAYVVKSDSIPSAIGVEIRTDGILATGPGRAHLRLRGSADQKEREALGASDEARLNITMPVVGSTSPARLSAVLKRDRRVEVFVESQQTVANFVF